MALQESKPRGLRKLLGRGGNDRGLAQVVQSLLQGQAGMKDTVDELRARVEALGLQQRETYARFATQQVQQENTGAAFNQIASSDANAADATDAKMVQYSRLLQQLQLEVKEQQLESNRRHAESDSRHAASERRHDHSDQRHAHLEHRQDVAEAMRRDDATRLAFLDQEVRQNKRLQQVMMRMSALCNSLGSVSALRHKLHGTPEACHDVTVLCTRPH